MTNLCFEIFMYSLCIVVLEFLIKLSYICSSHGLHPTKSSLLGTSPSEEWCRGVDPKNKNGIFQLTSNRFIFQESLVQLFFPKNVWSYKEFCLIFLSVFYIFPSTWKKNLWLDCKFLKIGIENCYNLLLFSRLITFPAPSKWVARIAFGRTCTKCSCIMGRKNTTFSPKRLSCHSIWSFSSGPGRTAAQSKSGLWSRWVSRC